jgi:hypothetical protein
MRDYLGRIGEMHNFPHCFVVVVNMMCVCVCVCVLKNICS